MCLAALPKHVNSTEATIILLFNIFLPGVGTMIASVMGHSCRCDTFLVGCLQLVTAPLLVGWIWSIWWGLGACGRVGKGAREGDVEAPRTERTERSGRSEGKSRHSGSHGKSKSGKHGHSGQGSDRTGHSSSQAHQTEAQEGFPQAYPQQQPDPAYPPPAYAQQPYPADYPPTKPPL